MNEKLKELIDRAGWSGIEEIERFAELVDAAAVAREREACANLSDEFDDDVGQAISIAIRGRTEPKSDFKNQMNDNWAGLI
jgi:hypothetical protein